MRCNSEDISNISDSVEENEIIIYSRTVASPNQEHSVISSQLHPLTCETRSKGHSQRENTNKAKLNNLQYHITDFKCFIVIHMF